MHPAVGVCWPMHRCTDVTDAGRCTDAVSFEFSPAMVCHPVDKHVDTRACWQGCTLQLTRHLHNTKRLVLVYVTAQHGGRCLCVSWTPKTAVPVCIFAAGAASRLTRKLEPLERTYTGTLRLGISTNTYDAGWVSCEIAGRQSVCML